MTVIEPKLESSRRFSRYYTVIEPMMARPEVKAYGMLILSFLTMTFFAFFAIKPTLITMSILKKQISDAQFVNQKLQEKINALSQARVAYEEVKPELSLISTALPLETNFAPFIKNLESIATASGVNIVNLNFQPLNLSLKETTDSANAKETAIGFNLTVNGGYTALAEFVKRLSYFERIATIKSLGFSKENQQDRELKLTLTGETYYVQ